MTSRAQTPSLRVTQEAENPSNDDVTERERSPVEDAFYESFLLQSRSDIGNLYASNIYWSQKHAKEVKDIERQKMVCMSSMTKEQKEMLKKMNKLQEKQERIQEEKRKQFLLAKVKAGHRIRPQSTSAVPIRHRRVIDPRMRSESMSYLDSLDLPLEARNLSKSTENLHDISRLSVSPESKMLSKSCEDLSGLSNIKSNKVILPSISKSSSSENLSDDDSVFITKVSQPSPPPKPRSSLLTPTGFNPERRRGSLPNPAELDRQLSSERRKGLTEIEPLKNKTQTKWVPKTFMPQGRSLPPI